jgi:lipoate-protein ligase A
LTRPPHNLACDEALLESAEAGERRACFAFLGIAELFRDSGLYQSRRDGSEFIGVPGAKCAGFAAVAAAAERFCKGRAAFNYALIYPIEAGQALNVGATNDFVMETNRRALEEASGTAIELAGHTDMAIEGRKFSGNAQKRKARFFLFHGTILLDSISNWCKNCCFRLPKSRIIGRAARTLNSFVICDFARRRESCVASRMARSKFRGRGLAARAS